MSRFVIHQHQLLGSHIREYSNALLDPNQPPKLEIKQYVPERNQNPGAQDVTFIFAGGIGFIKELYEPFFDDVEKASKKEGYAIRGIWVMDMYTVGASGLSNKDNLGDSPSWYDHSRDLIHMINHFAQDMPQPIFGIGHSMGAAQIANASLLHPNLFTSIILMEPAIYPGLDRQSLLGQMKGMSRRREIFKSEAEAKRTIHKNPFYRSWDPRALQALLQHGMISPEPAPQYDDETGPEHNPRKIVTSKYAELGLIIKPNFERVGQNSNQQTSLEERQNHPDIDLSLPDPVLLFPIYRPETNATYQKLPHIRPSVLYICSDKSVSSTPETRKRRLETTGTGVGGSGGVNLGRVSEVVLDGGQHTIPMDREHLPAVVDAVGKWVKKEMDIWMAKEEKRKEYWTEAKRHKEGGERLTSLDPESLDLIRNWDGKKGVAEVFESKMNKRATKL